MSLKEIRVCLSRTFFHLANATLEQHKPAAVPFYTGSVYLTTIDVDLKAFFKFYLLFYKKRVLMFTIFYICLLFFLVAKFCVLLNLQNSYIKRLLTDGFNMAAIGNSLMKSHSSQT